LSLSQAKATGRATSATAARTDANLFMRTPPDWLIERA
jgi:hypothetical protein